MSHFTINGCLWAFSALIWLAAGIFQFMAKNYLVGCMNIGLLLMSTGLSVMYFLK